MSVNARKWVNGNFNLVSFLLSAISILLAIISFFIIRFASRYDKDMEMLDELEHEIIEFKADHDTWKQLKAKYDTANIIMVNMAEALYDLRVMEQEFQKETRQRFSENEKEILELWKSIKRSGVNTSSLDKYKSEDI